MQQVYLAREEVVLAFGVIMCAVGRRISRTNRIALNLCSNRPFNRVVTEYETKLGTLKDSAGPEADAAKRGERFRRSL
jgi:hypothetical protein